MTDPPDAYLLAGGRGMRLRPLTEHTPKPLCALHGRAGALGMDPPTCRGGPPTGSRPGWRRPSTLPAPWSPARGVGVRVDLHTEPIPLGSGGALRRAGGAAGHPLLVISADVVTGVSLTRMLQHHQRSGATATVLAARHNEPADFEVVDVADGRIRSFVEKPDHPIGPSLVTGGIYVWSAT